MKKISSIEDFNKVVEKEGSVLILKHSLTCPISKAAYEEYEKFTADNPNMTSYYLAVQEARPLSNHIADTYQIKHESPQAVLFVDSKVVWHASHWNITYDTLTKAASEQK